MASCACCCAFLVASSICFWVSSRAWLAWSWASWALLAVVVSADNLSGGIAAAVFIAYLSSLTNQAYTATQYALFSSLMTLPAKVIGGFSGVVVDAQGYMAFFLYAGLLGIPAMVMKKPKILVTSAMSVLLKPRSR